MRTLSYLIVFCVVLVAVACNGGRSGNGNTKKTDVILPSTVNRDKRFTYASLPADVLYFTKPFTDTIRYTRFFSTVRVNDSSFIDRLNEVFQGTPEVLAGPKECLSEGKIQLPLGGDAYKVLYFSRLSTSCPYIYSIEQGMFHYYKMSAELNDELASLEKPKKGS